MDAALSGSPPLGDGNDQGSQSSYPSQSQSQQQTPASVAIAQPESFN